METDWCGENHISQASSPANKFAAEIGATLAYASYDMFFASVFVMFKMFVCWVCVCVPHVLDFWKRPDPKSEHSKWNTLFMFGRDIEATNTKVFRETTGQHWRFPRSMLTSGNGGTVYHFCFSKLRSCPSVPVLCFWASWSPKSLRNTRHIVKTQNWKCKVYTVHEIRSFGFVLERLFIHSCMHS